MNITSICVIVLYCAIVAALPTSPGNGVIKKPAGPQVEEMSIGGKLAEIGQFPFQVSIQGRDYFSSTYWRHFCGGSIISHHTVLTAAHCTLKYDISNTRVVAGEFDLSYEEGNEQVRSVSRVIAHPKFVETAHFMPYDVAILLVNEPFEFNNYVNSIKIAYLNHFPKGIATLSGWGYTSEYYEVTPDQLRTEDLPILNHSHCLSALEKVHDYMMPDSVLCTGPLNGLMGPCFGDSGGPLAQDGVVVGIASFVLNGCAHVGYPSGFTRVSAYTDWILQEDSNIRKSSNDDYYENNNYKNHDRQTTSTLKYSPYFYY